METRSSFWLGACKKLCIVICCFSVLQNHAFTSTEFAEATSNVHIVYMGEKQYEDPATVRKLHYEMLSTLLGSKEAAKSSIVYSYKHGFSGFAARLTQAQAEKIAEFPDVVQVFPSRIHKLHTTRSWDFLGLERYSSENLLAGRNMGDGVIIGMIDSGVWPESESFSDEGMGPLPSRWKGTCEQGVHFNHSSCNKKLIGARWFFEGLSHEIKIPINETNNIDFLSPRDSIGHGTHTASTAAGCFVEGATYNGLALGVARGGAPRANLAIYKACWGILDGGCADADILKAFDKAIDDGVDVLSVSIGISIPSFSYADQRDSIAIGSFHATKRGITVVSSGGNDGPFSQTIVNTAPWLITVAATTIDRAFPTAITLGNNHTLMGQSLDVTRRRRHRFMNLVYSERVAVHSSDDSASCHLGSLNATLAAGKVVLCFSAADQQNMVSASRAVFKAGGVGLIYAQFGDNLLDPCHKIPCVRVDFEVGTQILLYIRRASFPTVKLSLPRTAIGESASPCVAYFSSRGPSSIFPGVLKPDIAAPGVSILAAVPPEGNKKCTTSYAILSGTSMSCPHVSGIVALIKSAHPDWSPAAIRSALVTSASQKGTDGSDITEVGPTRKVADPFDIGGGLVNPNRALNPGLVYNISTEDYVQFLCDIGHNNLAISRLTKTTTKCNKHRDSILNLNLPSITVPNFKKRTAVTRTLTNVGDTDSVYEALVQAPSGVQMVVEPRILHFNSTIQALSFKVTFFSTQKREIQGDYRFGSLIWTDGKHYVRSPVSVRVIKTDSYADV